MAMAYSIHCDGDSPDCVIVTEIQFSASTARRIANRVGWKRVKENSKMIDLCPICYMQRKHIGIAYVPVSPRV